MAIRILVRPTRVNQVLPHSGGGHGRNGCRYSNPGNGNTWELPSISKEHGVSYHGVAFVARCGCNQATGIRLEVWFVYLFLGSGNSE